MVVATKMWMWCKLDICGGAIGGAGVRVVEVHVWWCGVTSAPPGMVRVHLWW